MHQIASLTADAWGDYIEAHLAQGWQPFLLTFIFNPPGGGQAVRMAQMTRLLEQAYAVFVIRVVRKPKTAGARGVAPIWLCAPDMPVYKRTAKHSLRDLVVNDGLHYHAILLLPPWSRLDDVQMHFEDPCTIYRQRAMLDRVDVEPIIDRYCYVVGYGYKSVIKQRFEVGDAFVLPRAVKELEGKTRVTRDGPVRGPACL